MKTLLLAALLLAPPAPQRQYIDVGSPDFRPLPLAVVPFQAEADARAGAVEVEQVLRDDLLLSGVFDLLDPKSSWPIPRRVSRPAPSASRAGATWGRRAW